MTSLLLTRTCILHSCSGVLLVLYFIKHKQAGSDINKVHVTGSSTLAAGFVIAAKRCIDTSKKQETSSRLPSLPLPPYSRLPLPQITHQ